MHLRTAIEMTEALDRDNHHGITTLEAFGDDVASTLLARVKELEAWQRAVAEGTGFINRAEGQSGYEVADPKTILKHFEDVAHERNRLCGDLNDVLRSATPHPVHHPTMHAAWKQAQATLAEIGEPIPDQCLN